MWEISFLPRLSRFMWKWAGSHFNRRPQPLMGTNNMPTRTAENGSRTNSHSVRFVQIRVKSPALARYLKNGFDFDRDVAGERTHPHGAARADALLRPEDFGKQFAAA